MRSLHFHTMTHRTDRHLSSTFLAGNAQSTSASSMRRAPVFALLSALLLAAGCKVGPKYVMPTAPVPPVAAYKEQTPESYKGVSPGTWRPAQPQDAVLKGKWWEIFNEPELNALEEQLDINNQNIAQYFQNFLASRTIVRETNSQLYPTLSVGPSYQRAKSPSTLRGVGLGSSTGTAGAGTTGGTGTTGTGTTGTGTGGTGTGGTGTGTGGTGTGGTGTTTSSTQSGNTFTSIGLPFDASWAPDLWGRVRSQIDEYRFAAQVSAADLENERLVEQATLAEYYFQLRGQDALQDLYNRTVQADQQALDLTQVLVETGIDSPESTAQAEVTLRDAQESGAGIASNRALYEHAIATLIGKPASSFAMPVRSLTTPLPAIPVGLPSELLQRRPDVAAAERTLAEANAAIGVEKAAYYPELTLSGSGGLESSSITTLFSVPGFFWSTGASASQFLFDAGLRKATVAQYTAQYNADVASYRQTVLTAFQQVEDYISTIRVANDQDIREQAAVGAAQRYLDIAQTRYRTGLDPYLNVITAQTTLLTNQQTQVTLRVSEMTAAVQLIQALGGGWNVNQLPPARTITGAAAARQAAATP